MYLDKALFAQAGVAVRYMDYAGYPEYPQLYPPFEHAVTVLDLLFMTGTQAPAYFDRGRRRLDASGRKLHERTRP